MASPTIVWAAGSTELVSVGLGGARANGRSFGPTITPSGRFVLFGSDASNLVPGDTNGAADVFLRDRWTGRSERVSVSTGGTQANGFGSFASAITPEGRFVAFASDATNLVPGDTNSRDDVFVRDRRSGSTQRVSVGAGGLQANEASFVPAISANGRFVAFASRASNLVPGDTNGVLDVFVRDRWTRQTERVSTGRDGVQANGQSVDAAISADGNVVVFSSAASNLVPGDTNGRDDVFARDRRTGATTRVNVGPGGAQAMSPNDATYGVPSADGRFVAFVSPAVNLVPGDTNGAIDAFVRDRRAGVTRRVNVGPGGVEARSPNSDFGTQDVAISPGGRFVAFSSYATNLVPGDTNGNWDIFVRDRQTGRTERVNLGPGGVQSNAYGSFGVSISAGGRFVAFDSEASNLVPGGAPGGVFVRVR